MTVEVEIVDGRRFYRKVLSGRNGAPDKPLTKLVPSVTTVIREGV